MGTEIIDDYQARITLPPRIYFAILRYSVVHSFAPRLVRIFEVVDKTRMKVYENKSQFGWESDDGIGERLIQQIIRSEKTATAGPKEIYSVTELQDLYGSIGRPATVIDKHQKPRCNIKILDVFETKFGSLDPRLVKGKGMASMPRHFENRIERHGAI